MFLFMMVFSLRKCPGVEGKVCNLFLPCKENDPIACVLPVVANPAGVTIAVRNAMIGVTIAGIVWLVTWPSFCCSLRRNAIEG